MEDVLVLNPRKKKRKKSTRKGAVRKTSRRAYVKKAPKRRRKRNPVKGMFGIDWNTVFWTTVGAVSSRAIPQYVPMIKNVDKGIVGVGLNLGTGLTIASFMAGKKKADIINGTAVASVIRLLNETLLKRRQISIDGLGQSGSMWDQVVKEDPSIEAQLQGFGDVDDIEFGDVYDELDGFDYHEGVDHEEDDPFSDELTVSGYENLGEDENESDSWDY